MARTRRFRGNRARGSRRKAGFSNFLGKPVRKKIEIDFGIYAVFDTASKIGRYAYNTLTTANYCVPIVSNLAGGIGTTAFPTLTVDSEFISMGNKYNWFKINGCMLTYDRSFMNDVSMYSGTNPASPTFIGANKLSNMPAFSMMIGADRQGTSALTQTLVWAQDNAMRVQTINSDSSPIKKFYSFPGSFHSGPNTASGAGSVSAPICGNKLWINFYSFFNGQLSNEDQLCAYIGFVDNPQLTTATAQTNTWCKVGTGKVTFYLTFGGPVLQPVRTLSALRVSNNNISLGEMIDNRIDNMINEI